LHRLIDGKAFSTKSTVPMDIPQKDTVAKRFHRFFRIGHSAVRITVLPRPYEKELGKTAYSFDCALPKRRSHNALLHCNISSVGLFAY